MTRLPVSYGFSLSFLMFSVLFSHVQAKPLAMIDYRSGYSTSLTYYAPADRGCALCRNEENCSLAVHNQSEGVFCSDILYTFQPCCCSFRNECITTIFSDSCECFNGVREEEIMTTRFYLLMGLSIIAWGLLVYEKMCARPYKVMNCNHEFLANSPSVAREEDSTVDSNSEDEGSSVDARSVAVEVAEESHVVDNGMNPLRSRPSLVSDEVRASAEVEAVVDETQANGERLAKASFADLNSLIYDE